MTFIQHTYRYLFASPTRLFWAFALTHLVLWTLIPSLTNPNLPLDVIEGYAWGKEWLLGTYKHPPMQAWILESLYHLTGRERWAPYLASQIAIVVSFWAVWQTGRRIAGEKVALISVLILEGIIYYNFTSPEFNPNVLQLPFWALAGWSFHKAVTDDALIDWILLGVWAALGMYTKYSSGLFLLVLFLAMLAHRDGRARLARPGPYLAVLTGFVLFLPHLLWLMQNDYMPLQYAAGRMERSPTQYSTAITTTLMVLGQVIALLFALLLVVALYDRRGPSRKPAQSFDRIFLTFAAFGPFLSMFCMSLVFSYHIRDMWETPFWNFVGIWVVVFMRPALTPIDMRRFGLAWVIVFIVGLLSYVTEALFSPYLTSKPKRTIFPGKHLSNTITDAWHARYGVPLSYVVGDTWPAGNIAWYANDRPHVFLDGEAHISPWINIHDLKKKGGVIVWCVSCGHVSESQPEPAALAAEFPQAEIQPILVLKRITDANVPPAHIGWAIVPPQETP
jgi:4-amino-4-deoxy-L-arabinose transferase-like glycosyltransferase